MKKGLLFGLSWIVAMAMAQAQDSMVSGKVTSSEDGLGIPGVNVVIKGTAQGTITDADGNYTLAVLDKLGTLVYSYVGMLTQDIAIGDRTTIDVQLSTDSQQLSEVVVTALGISREKKSLGYAITQVESEEIEQRPEADLSRTLQGKIAGVQISAASGETGGATSIRVRSSLSINQTNDPLIIVNNVPFGGSIRDIDANDIEEMNVLKGLNASILYGSQGRNGVIIIQTKSGKMSSTEKGIQGTFSQTAYVNSVANLPDYQDKYGQGSEFGFAAGNVGTWGPAYSNLDSVVHPYAHLSSIFPEYKDMKIPYRRAKDNIKKLFNNGVGTITSINISSTKDKTTYSLSVGYTKEKGIIGNNDLKRFNIGLGGNSQLTDRLRISTTLNYSTRSTNTLQISNLFEKLLFLPPNIDLTTLPYQHPQTGASIYYRPGDENPLWIINNTGENDDKVRVFGTANLTYQLTDHINLNYRIGLDSDSKNKFEYANKGGQGDNQPGFLELQYDKRVILDQSIIVGIQEVNLLDKIQLDAQVGINSNLLNGKMNKSESKEQIVFDYLNPKDFKVTTATHRKYTQNLAGVFGQLEFSYNQFLYLSLSGRNDWGSTVEPQHRSLFYPGVSMSFIPTSAFANLPQAIDFLKFRVAYATSAGFPSRYNTRPVLATNPNRMTTNKGEAIITNTLSDKFANPNLKPELHKETELGLEATLLDSRVTFEASVFHRISENQILEAARPPSSGYTSTKINAGRIDTKGIEIDLGVGIFSNDNLGWNMRNLFTSYKTTVVDLPQERISLGNKRYAIEGQPFGVLRGDYALRDDKGNFLIDPTNGYIILNSNVGLEDKIIGDPTPDWSLTNINNLRYKNFALSVQLEYTHGGDIVSNLVSDLMKRGVTKDTENREGTFVIPGIYGDPETGKPLLDENGKTIKNTIQMNAQRLYFHNYYRDADDLKIFDASMIRLREISIAYTLDNALLTKLPFNNLTISVAGRNLWYKAFHFPKYINYDPENDGGNGSRTVPTTKRFSISVSASF